MLLGAPTLELRPGKDGLAGIDGEKTRSARAWVRRGEGVLGSREAQETCLSGPSARRYHIRGMGHAGGTRATLALKAPGWPGFPDLASPAPGFPGWGHPPLCAF